MIRDVNLGRDFASYTSAARCYRPLPARDPRRLHSGAEADAKFESNFVARETGLASGAADWIDLLLAMRGSGGVTEGIRPFDHPATSGSASGCWRGDARLDGPNVTVRIVPLEDAGKLTADNKNLPALLFYEIDCEMRRGSEGARTLV
jgi:hypothetical protein